MEINIFAIIKIIILIVIVFSTIKFIFIDRPLKIKFILYYIASFLLLIGAVSFFGSAIINSMGELILPNNFQWPIGKADNILVTKDKKYIVPHEETGRIQIYNRNLEFIRGWNVNASGGAFKIVLLKSNLIEVYIARENYMYVYDVEGNKISKNHYNRQYYDNIPLTNKTLNIPTPFYLLPFTNSFLAFFFFLLGLILLIIIERVKIWIRTFKK